jgi:exodeoxyribonuclease V alpha subunit
VLIEQNDYVLKLYNGDVGIALPDDGGNLLVHFRSSDGAFRSIAPMRLPPHDTAFAMTVHKAQGSEFDAIALVLPAGISPLLTRELVYTAITRARSRVSIVSGQDVLEHAIRTATVRHSGLHARLREVQRGLHATGGGTILRA